MSDLNLAIVKNNLWGDEDLPEEFYVDDYAAAGKYQRQYEDKKGRNQYKKRMCAGAGVDHIRKHGREAKGPNAAAGFEMTKDGVRAVAQAEVCSESVHRGDLNKRAGLLKAGAEFEGNLFGVKAGAQAEVCSFSVSNGDFKSGVDALKAGAGFEGTPFGIKAVAQAEAIRSSMSYGPVGVEAGLLKADAKFEMDPVNGINAKVDAKLGEVSASAGPLKATLAVSAETGIGIGGNGAEVMLLGTGLRLGRENGIFLGGTGFSFRLPWWD